MKRLLTAVMVTAALASIPAFANAAETTATTKAEVVTQQAADALQISEQGYIAVQDVRMARMAIFEGVPEHAVKLTDTASKLLSDDSADWKKFTHISKKATLSGDRYIVIDGSIGISENFIATPEKTAAIKAANEKLAAGDKKGALKVLHLADISVTQNLYLLPLKQSQKAIAEAKTLLSEKKFYEANLVLKSIEDSVIIDGAAVIAD